jgi:hypothetical protein
MVDARVEWLESYVNQDKLYCACIAPSAAMRV